MNTTTSKKSSTVQEPSTGQRTETKTGATSDSELVAEWEIMPTIRHPDPGGSEYYPCAPGRTGGLTARRAKELATGRNRVGEPSPSIQWKAQPTGEKRPVSELQD